MINETIELSRAISELGVLVVIAGLMIVIFVTAIVFIFRIIRSTNDKMLESQKRSEKLTEQIIAQNETIQGLLTKIAVAETEVAKIEQTKYNAERLLRVSFDMNMVALLKGVSEIISYNHIDDKPYTESRVKALVSSAHHDRVKWLNAFKYSGTRLGDLANYDNWIDKKVEIIISYIYSKDRNKELLMRDLTLTYVEFSNQLDI